jgi:hypothetical protein
MITKRLLRKEGRLWRLAGKAAYAAAEHPRVKPEGRLLRDMH